jgi:hypothetical protein
MDIVMEVASRMPNCGNSSRNEAFCVAFGRKFGRRLSQKKVGG